MDAIFRFISKKRYGVTGLLLIVVNDNIGESQIEIQIRKKVNKYTNIIIIPIIYCSYWSSTACYLKVKIMLCFDSLYIKLKLMYLRESYLLCHSFLINLRFQIRYCYSF